MMGNVVNLYACGGAGLNIASSLEKFRGTTEEGFATVDTFYIDTSKSNLKFNPPEDSVFLIEGVDGSGKKRDQNYELIYERSKEMLQQFKPADVNIVLHSASGGSGSVIGPVLVSELLNRGENVIVIMVGSRDSRIEINNTIKTIMSYEMISNKRELPVIATYYENSNEEPRSSVDASVLNAITLLSAIFSKDNAELDSSDLNNFLNYHNVTSYSPRLAFLDFYSKDIALVKGQTVISVVTLGEEGSPTSLKDPVEYQAAGFMCESAIKRVDLHLPIHTAVINGTFNIIIKRLNDVIQELDTARSAVVEKPLLKGNEKATNDGLML
jgi:hypothetical protein